MEVFQYVISILNQNINPSNLKLMTSMWKQEQERGILGVLQLQSQFKPRTPFLLHTYFRERIVQVQTAVWDEIAK